MARNVLVIVCSLLLGAAHAEKATASPLLDIDGDGEIKALSDGLIIIRHLFGFTGDALVQGAVAPDCTRCSADEISEHLDQIFAMESVEAPVFNAGDIVLFDANDVNLGAAEAEKDRVGVFSMRVPVDRKNVAARKFYVVNNAQSETVEIVGGWHSSNKLYFQTDDCSGSVFIARDRADISELDGVLLAPPPYPLADYQYLLFKSRRRSAILDYTTGVGGKKSPAGDCETIDTTIYATVADVYIPTEALQNAAYPVRLEQLP
jgi:hypothetical protein